MTKRISIFAALGLATAAQSIPLTVHAAILVYTRPSIRESLVSLSCNNESILRNVLSTDRALHKMNHIIIQIARMTIDDDLTNEMQRHDAAKLLLDTRAADAKTFQAEGRTKAALRKVLQDRVRSFPTLVCPK